MVGLPHHVGGCDIGTVERSTEEDGVDRNSRG
jgi:hypothetical protein